MTILTFSDVVRGVATDVITVGPKSGRRFDQRFIIDFRSLILDAGRVLILSRVSKKIPEVPFHSLIASMTRWV